jgi:uncharacterized protein
MSLPGKITTGSDIVRRTEKIVREKLGDEPTGHDWWHAHRVRTAALRTAGRENADPVIVELAALLHDVEDDKFSGDPEAGPRFAYDGLGSLGLAAPVPAAVAQIIRGMSFRGAGVDTPVLHRPLHDPELAPVLHTTAESYRSARGTTINHFHEKLLLLRARMNTETGRRLAHRREGFLREFETEWNALD